MTTYTTITLEDVLNESWLRRISDEVSPNVLTWETDSVCGEATLRITRLADYVAAEWPDVAREVINAAVHQISIVCIG